MSPTGSAACAPVAGFCPAFGAGFTDPVVFAAGSDVGPAVFAGAPVVFGAPLATLLAGLEGIGPATLVQVSPPQRKPSTQP